MNEQLNKLIEQAFKENVSADPHTGNLCGKNDFMYAVKEILDSRPTCGVEQRKFLDVIEKDGVIEDGNLGQTMYIGETSMSEISSNDFNPISLEKVIKGK